MVNINRTRSHQLRLLQTCSTALNTWQTGGPLKSQSSEMALCSPVASSSHKNFRLEVTKKILSWGQLTQKWGWDLVAWDKNVQQGLVNVQTSPNYIGDIISNKQLKVMFKITKKGHVPTPVEYQISYNGQGGAPFLAKLAQFTILWICGGWLAMAEISFDLGFMCSSLVGTATF